uniref:RING-type domain-containing protein n=1 Tax=Panagrolaimus superbus TaxID=310955 RepID=A0A914Y003_9BILA
MDANTQALLSIIQRYNQAQADQQQVAQYQRQTQQALIQHTQMMTANGTIPTTLSAILQQFPNNIPSNPAALNTPPQGMHFTPIPNVTVPTPPVYASLPSHPALNMDMPLYYQQYLNQSLMCMCACASTCPVHDGNHQVLIPQQSTSSSLLGNHPLRHMVPPQPQPQRTSPSPATQQRLLTQAIVNRTRQYVEESQIRMQHQQRQVHLASAIAAVASGSSSTQPQSQQQQHHQQQPPPPPPSQPTTHRDSSIRQKRPATFGTDGRPSSKVRRVISMDGNTPSSSQVPTERYETSEMSQSSNNNPARAQSVFRVCSNCQQRFTTTSPPASFCPCHNSDTCPFTGSVCQLCIYGMIPPQERPSQISSVVNQQYISNRNTHSQRHREAANLFYQQNLFENPAPPPPPGGVLVVNNRAPYMDILFFTPGESTVTGISGLPHLPTITPTGSYNQQTIAQQQIQTLHQVLSQNPHISEPPPIGATVDEIKKKTTIMNYTKDLNVPEEETERCTVCLSDFETGDEVRTLNCSHIFHTECIDRWLIYNKKCPICRVEMDRIAGYGALCDLFRQSYEQASQQVQQQAAAAVANATAAAAASS